MELRLPWKAQTHTGVERIDGRTLDLLNIREPSAMRCFQFAFKHLFGTFWRNKEVAIKAFEVTNNFFFSDDGFNTVYRCRMTLSSEPCAFFAVHTLDLKITVINRIENVRRCTL